jgi:hypothetical protein
MDRNLPRVLSGTYGVEREGDHTFAWTSSRAMLSLPGADRRVPWSCTVRLDGGRPAGVPLPTVAVSSGDATLATVAAGSGYQDVEVVVPPDPAATALRLTIGVEPTFVPGPGDSRALGVRIDRLACGPAAGVPIPPGSLLVTGGVSAGFFGTALGVISATPGPAIAGTLVVAALQAFPLTTPPAPYGTYLQRVPVVAAVAALLSSLAVIAIEGWRKRPLSGAARFAIACSGAACFLELIVLMHPAKLPVDAIFHAHRLEWVMAGRYFFTQPLPDGVQFPYAIALYVVAAPFGPLVQDHVTLLRAVVIASRALAALLLYPVIVRAWNDRLAAAAAVALLHVVPLPFVVIGNANLTFAFGQSMALAALAGAMLVSGKGVSLALLFIAASVAFLSHVGIFPVLFGLLVAIAVGYRAVGGVTPRPPAFGIIGATVLAAFFAVSIYYARFPEAYQSFQRVRARPAAAPAPASPAAAGTQNVQADPSRDRGAPVLSRARRAVTLGIVDMGWPLLLLAVLGASRLASTGVRDRLSLAILATSAAYVVVLVASVAAPVDARFQRYTDEFIERVNYTVMPMIVALAARGVSWGWAARPLARLLTAFLVLAAALAGLRIWAAWLG